MPAARRSYRGGRNPYLLGREAIKEQNQYCTYESQLQFNSESTPRPPDEEQLRRRTRRFRCPRVGHWTARTKVRSPRGNSSAHRKPIDLDALKDEIERLTQEWVKHVDATDEESQRRVYSCMRLGRQIFTLGVVATLSG